MRIQAGAGMVESGKVVRIADFKPASSVGVTVPVEESLRLLSAFCGIADPKQRLRLLKLLERTAAQQKPSQG